MFKIAIDGPAGAGKSTISKIVAEKLGFQYIDTGAMYRAITYKAIKLGVDLEKEESYDFLNNTKLDVDGTKIYIDNQDVSTEIRSVEITTNVSTPSKIGVVRSWLVDYQRRISDSKNVVMDGRDIGTVVLPNADLKIYLDASAECRAERRRKERLEKGVDISLEETLEEIKTRDFKDSTREISPLKKADDAVLVDSSNMSIEEVVDTIIGLVNEYQNKKQKPSLNNYEKNDYKKNDYENERGSNKMSNVKFFEGQEVKGIINNVTKDAVYVELEGENKGVIYTNDLADYVEGQKLRDYYYEGQDFKALVKQVAKDKKSNNPLYILSTSLYSAKDDIKVFEELKENDEVIEAEVVNVTRAGADLRYKEYNNIKIFLPAKNIDLSEEALYSLKRQTIEVLITFVDVERFRVTVSHTAVMNKKARIAKAEAKALKDAAYAKLSVGETVKGEVISVLDFGAIIDLGEGVTGLLHRNELDHKLVRNVNDYVKVGDTVKAQIIKKEDGKLGLSKKALIDHPWDILKGQYHVGDVFDGTVTKVIPAGLIIKLTEEYSGLMPRSEYAWLINERLDNNVKEGDTITVKVMEIDSAKKRVSLSHRATLANPWGDVKVRRGDVITVEIASVEEKGAKVKFQEVEGFLPVNEVTAQKRISRVDEVFPVGEKVEVSVTDCDALRGKLVVSAKLLETKKERAEFDKYYAEQEKEIPTNTIADLLGDALKDKLD